MHNDPATIAAYVVASAELTSMPLDDERRAAVQTVMTRIVTFAADLAAFELPDTIEIAGVFRP
jgi:hypothetical protein